MKIESIGKEIEMNIFYELNFELKFWKKNEKKKTIFMVLLEECV